MEGTTLINHVSRSLLAKTPTDTKSLKPIFILCDRCYWCATYFSNTRTLMDSNCPQCNANSNELTSFAIAPNESFTFGCNEKRGVELEFKHRIYAQC
jgi:predicted Zn-ribbon and HTH transcriptional regulator